MLLTQWAFFRRARASILVPAYKCTYVAVPVILQVLLLPRYSLNWVTILGLGLIMIGFVLMRGLRSRTRKAAVPDSGPETA